MIHRSSLIQRKIKDEEEKKKGRWRKRKTVSSSDDDNDEWELMVDDPYTHNSPPRSSVPPELATFQQRRPFRPSPLQVAPTSHGLVPSKEDHQLL